MIILMIFINYGVAGQDAETRLTEYIVTAETANLRTGPGTNFSVAGTVTRGETLLVIEDASGSEGWLRVSRESGESYIADFLVEKAPIRFYPLEQEPIVVASGRGKGITEVFDFPRSAYRIDAQIEDRSFILKIIVVEGECDDDIIFNELNFDTTRLTISGLFVSSGCSIIFETDNVDRNWSIEVRDILDDEFLIESFFEIEDGSTISGVGRNLTMGTFIGEGIWTINANVLDRSYILRSHVLSGDCEDTVVFNELDFDASSLEVSTVYRNRGDEACVVFWETDNVDSEWSLTFNKLR
jgi:hypothetical protein